MPNNFPISVGSTTPEPTTGDYLVSFIDFDGTILKEQWVNHGQAATAPTPPIHQYLTFDEWNNAFTNIQHDLDVGATYYTTDGKTYLFMRFTNTTGLQPSIYLNKATTAQMNIDWGDGTGTSLSGSGNITITKAAPYAAIGDYTITIECAENWSFYTYIFNNDANYNGCLLRCYLGSHLVSLGNYTFHSTNLVSISINKSIVQILVGVFYRCFNLFAVIIPSGLTSIGGVGTYGDVFYEDRSLKYAILPLTFIVFTRRLFYGCYNLEKVNIADHMSFTSGSQTNIFFDNHALRKILIPEATTSLGQNIFYGCLSLYEINLHYGITSINSGAFYDCKSVLKYVILPSTPPSLANAYAFDPINLARKIYVPDASVAAYQDATNWNSFPNYIYPISELSEYDGTIFFQCNGGIAVKQITGTVGAVATEPTAPIKSGFAFNGWYKDELLTEAWNWSSDVYPATNITLYAKWV